MPHALIPRATVHAWSDEIAERLEQHQTSLQRLMKDQRRLTRFIEENREQMTPQTAGVCMYMTSVIARMFEMAGGTLRSGTWEQVRAASAKVAAGAKACLPLDDGFIDRFHALPDRAQAHILDEAAMVLLQVRSGDDAQDLDNTEALKVLFVSWVVTEVLDACWRPPADFQGEATYTYTHIDPPAPLKLPEPTEG
jgi:hypothetical protein